MHRSLASSSLETWLCATTLFTLALIVPRNVEAFCRTAICGDDASSFTAGTRCTPAQPQDCGKPLFWAKPCIGFGLDERGTNQLPIDQVEAISLQALKTWTSSDCGAGAAPAVQLNYQGRLSCSTVEYNQSPEKGNANLITFHDDQWPHEGSINTLALTTVTYNLNSGEIYDADLEVNSTKNIELTGTEEEVKFDLLSILTHEAGHFLGLAHSPTPTATMFAEYFPGDSYLRDLDPDDVSAVCAAYPPTTSVSDSCDDTPRHGFDERCFGDRAGDGCEGCALSVAEKRRHPDGSAALLTSLLVMMLASSRITRRRLHTRAIPPKQHHEQSR